MKWTSKSGKQMYFSTPLMNVLDCLKIPEPYVGWMDKPKYRREFYSWIPENILQKYSLAPKDSFIL